MRFLGVLQSLVITGFRSRQESWGKDPETGELNISFIGGSAFIHFICVMIYWSFAFIFIGLLYKSLGWITVIKHVYVLICKWWLWKNLFSYYSIYLNIHVSQFLSNMDISDLIFLYKRFSIVNFIFDYWCVMFDSIVIIDISFIIIDV